jgi:hypothetical protein
MTTTTEKIVVFVISFIAGTFIGFAIATGGTSNGVMSRDQVVLGIFLGSVISSVISIACISIMSKKE